MATGSSPARREVKKPAGTYVEYDQFIEQQLRKTRGQVKGVDLTESLMVLTSGTLGYLLIAVLLDHWVVPRGLGFWGRLLSLIGLVGGVAWFFATHTLPLLIRKINPVYAARAIERSTPTLKNSLVNFLLLRSQRTGVSDAVYEAVEEQAASRLSKVSVESVVDRSKLLQIAYVLAAVVVIAALYKVFSPKDPLETVGRVALPWADIQAPSRVQITEVSPGETTAFRGQRAKVSAEIHGLAADETATLLYTTADGQHVDRPIEMRSSDGYRYVCELPELEEGLQYDLAYHVVAGDARSRSYNVKVVAAPTMIVETVEYEYPAYTGLEKRSVDRLGDIQGLEGTTVTITARANQPIRSANLNFDCDGTKDLSMQVDGQKARVRFPLALKKDSRSEPQHASYQLEFLNQDGQKNFQPTQHKIDVIADLAPEVTFLAPNKQEVEVPVNSFTTLEVRAIDPDFQLDSVLLEANESGKPVVEKQLLAKPHRGQFISKFDFVPGKLLLQEGDVVEYSATATDNKRPGPNTAKTPVYRLRIVGPSRFAEPPPDQIAQNDPKQQQQPDGTPNDNRRDRRENPQPPQEGQRQQRGQQDQPEAKPNAGEQRQQNDRDDEQQQGGDQEQNGSERGERNAAQQNKPNGQGDQSPDPREQQGGQNDQRQDGQSSEQKKVGADDDASAIEEILKHRQQQGDSGQRQGDKPQENQAQQQPGDRSQQQQSGEQGDRAREQQGQQARDGQRSENQDQQQGKQQNGQSGQQDQQQPADGQDGQMPNKGQGGAREQTGGRDQQQGKADPTQQKQQQRGSPRDQNQQRQGDNSKGPGEQQEQSGDRSKDQQDSRNGNKGQQPTGQERPGNQQGEPQKGGPGEQQQQRPGEKGGAGDKGGAGEEQQGADEEPMDQEKGGAGQQDQQQGEKDSGDQKPGDNKFGQGGSKQPQDGQQQKSPSKGSGQTKEQQQGQQGQGQQGQSKPMPGDGQQPEDGKTGLNEQTGEKTGREGQPSEREAQHGDRDPEHAERDSATGARDKQGKPQNGKEGQEKAGREKQPSGNEKSRSQANKQSPDRQSTKQGEQRSPSKDQGQASKQSERNQKGGEDGRANPGNVGRQEEAKPEKADETSKPMGGNPERPQGDAGAGQSKDDSATTEAQESPKATGKKQQKNSDLKQADESPDSPAHGNKETDSSSDSKGDRAGGGSKGGGQAGKQAGRGTPGENTSADQGKGAAQEQGSGETGENAGDDVKADGPTGKSGNEKGKGSQTRPAQSGESGQPGSPSDQQDESATEGDSRQPGTGKAGGSTGGNPTNGGERTGTPPPSAVEDDGSTGDDPNLEYARKATDLALDHLRNQMKQGEDAELLEQLGWSREEAERFLKRWDELQQKAKAADKTDVKAQQEFKDALRSLGLRPTGTVRRTDSGTDDKVRGLEEGRRYKPLPGYEEQYRAFKQQTRRD